MNEKATLQLTDPQINFNIVTGVAVTLRSLVLTGEFLMWKDCPETTEWCKHCLDKELLLPGHGTPMEGYTPSSPADDFSRKFQCASYQDSYFFLVAHRDASLTLDSCEVRQIRSRPTAIFLAFNSALIFLNTHFYALASATHPAAVVYFPSSLATLSNAYLRSLPSSLLDSCTFPHCGRLEMQGGSVQGLNRDHAFSTDNDMESGFLLGFNLKWVRIVDVHFLDNQISAVTLADRGLITLTETSLVEIADCAFDYCMGVSGVIFLNQARTSAYPGAYNDPQILITNTNFTGLFSQTDASVLNVHSTGLNPIIALTNVTIDSAHSFIGPNVIWLDFNTEYHPNDFNYANLDDPAKHVYRLTPGKVHFSGITLRNCAVADESGSHVYITGAEHVHLLDIQLANNVYAHAAFRTIFEHMAETGLHPLTEETERRFAQVESCLAAVSLDNVSEVQVLRWKVETTQCDAGLELISPRNSASIQTFQALDNRHGLLVSHTNDFLLLLSSSDFRGNLGSALLQNFNRRQTISLNQAATLVIDCTFQDNQDLQGKSGLAYYGGNLTVSHSHFLRNHGSVNSGIYVFLLYSETGKVSTVVVEDCEFASNTVIGYSAADIHIESISNSPEVVWISRCSFTSSQGGVIALVGLRLSVQSQLSRIQHCQFTDTQASVLGVIRSSQISGELLVSHCGFLRCQSPHGDDNCGVSVLTNTSTATNPTLTRIEDCRFEQAFGSSCIEVNANSLQQSSVATARCVFRDNIARAVLNAGGNYADQASVYVNNSADQGGAYLAQEASNSLFVNSTFVSNHASLEAGAFDISGPFSTAVFKGCLVSNNSADLKAGAATIENNVETLIEDTIFQHNSASEASVMYVSDIQGAPLILRNCSLWRNTGEKVILASVAQLLFEFTTIRDNRPLHLEAGIDLLMSSLRTSYCLFEELRGNVGCALELLLDSEWRDQGSTLRTSTCTSSIVEAQGSQLTLTGTQLRGLTVKLYAVLYIRRFSSLTLADVVFADSAALSANSAALLCEESSLSMQKSHFLRIQGYSVMATCPDIHITSSSFSDSTTLGEAALWIINPDQVSITDCHFKGLAGKTGGALHLHRDNGKVPFSMRNCTFEQCTGLTGAVRLCGVYADIRTSSFVNNVATGPGGGLYLNSTQGVNVTDCEFRSNQAGQGGGGLYWVATAPLRQNLTFSNNSAAYGPDLGSDASNVRLSSFSTELLEDFPSGQVLHSTVQFELVDQLGQVATTANNLYAKIAADIQEVLVSGHIEAKSASGKLDFEGFALTAAPGKAHNVSIVVDSLYVQPLIFTLNFRKCALGESVVNNACSVCPLNTYSLVLDSTHCEPCPRGADCLGGAKIYPQTGYWRASESSDLLWTCFSDLACIGSANHSSLLGFCAEGYRGPVCQSCEEDWARTGRDDCAACPVLFLTLLKMVGLGIVGLICLVFLVRSTMVNIKSGKFTSVYFRIFLNYLQITMLTSTFDLKWPEVAKQLFNTQDAVGGASQQFFSYDCVYYQVGFQDPVLFQDLAVVTIMPVLALLATASVWAVVSLKTGDRSYMLRQNVLSVVVIFFVVYPKLVNSTFSLFNCLEVLPGEWWLRRDMAIRCWDHKHTVYALGLALPSIVIWVFGVPLLVLCMLCYIRSSLHSPNIKLRFGFLYMGYVPERYYWEFVTLARKIAVLSVLSFTSSSSVQVQALTVLIVLLLALLLQLRFQPFLSSELNQLEFKSILTSAVTLICGLYYLASGLNVWLQLVLLVLIIAANAYFLVSWAKCLLMVYAVQVAAYCPAFCPRICAWFPSLRTLIPTPNSRIFPHKDYKYDVEVDASSSADLSSSHRDCTKVLPEPVTFNHAGPSLLPTPPDNTPDEEVAI